MITDINECNEDYNSNSHNDNGNDLDSNVNALMSLKLNELGIEIKHKEQFYDDKVYIDILKMISNDKVFGLVPQGTEIGKLRNIRSIIHYLSSTLELNLMHIDANDIIIHKDEEAVGYLIALFVDLVKVYQTKENSLKTSITTLDRNDYKEMRTCNSVDDSKLFTKTKLDKCLNDTNDSLLNIKESLIKKNKSTKEMNDLKPTCVLVDYIKDNVDQYKKFYEEANKDIQKDNNDNIVDSTKMHNDLKSNKDEGDIRHDIPLSIEELNKELINGMRNTLSKIQFRRIIDNQHMRSRMLTNIITLIKKTIPSNEVITHNYIQINKIHIHNIIQTVLNTLKKNKCVINSIAKSIIRDKPLLNQLHHDNYNRSHKTKLKTDDKNDKVKSKNPSNNYGLSMHIMYRQVLEIEKQNCIEEMYMHSDTLLQKEAQILIKNRLVSNQLIETKDRIYKCRRLEAIIKDKINELNELKALR